MGILIKGSALVQALGYGRKLANSAAWKSAAIRGNLVLFLGAIVALASAWGFDVHVSDALLNAVAGVLVSLYGLYNAYVHAATSETVGLRPVPPRQTPGQRPDTERESGPLDVD